MQHQQRTRWWQRLTIFGCLFGLSALAPAIWRAVQSNPPKDAGPGQLAEARWSAAALPQSARFPSDELLPAPSRITVYASAAVPLDRVDVEASLRGHREQIAGRYGRQYLVSQVLEQEVLAEDAAEDVRTIPAPEIPDYALATLYGNPLRLQTTRWALPTRLLEALDELALQPVCWAWATHTAELASSLPDAAAGEVATILQQLREQLEGADHLLTLIGDGELATRVRRARHAVLRRMDVWQGIATLETDQASHYVRHASQGEGLGPRVNAAEAFVERTSHGPGWRKYLMLAELRDLVSSPGPSPDPGNPQHVVRRAAARFDAPVLDEAQQRYLRSAPLVQLKNELLRATDDPLDATRLLATLEDYEASGLPSDAQELAGTVERLARSSQQEQQRLARTIQSHYQATNLRISISGELMARWMPEDRGPEYRPVRDVIQGVPVVGQSVTYSKAKARFLPSYGRTLFLELQAEGTVDSDTVGRTNMVATRSHTRSTFDLRKVLEMNSDGVKANPACAVRVCSNSQLCDLKTELDSVPLLGSFANSMAVQQYYKGAPARQQEVRQRVAMRALRRFEERAEPEAERLDKNFVQRLLVPLKRLELEPEAVVPAPQADETTLRFRLAGEQQLAAHTPRPRAVPAALASFQIHESTINNIIGQIDLDGRTLTAEQLRDRVNEKLNLKLAQDRKKAAKASFTFAKKDAVRVRLIQGQMRLTVSVTELAARGRTWKNLEMTFPYTLRPTGNTVELVPVSKELTIKGRLTVTDRAALEEVLSDEFFNAKKPYRLMGDMLDDERLSDLQVHQAVITDGWIGVSIGKGERE